MYNLSTRQSVGDHKLTQKCMSIANIINLTFLSTVLILEFSCNYIIKTPHFLIWLCFCYLSFFLHTGKTQFQKSTERFVSDDGSTASLQNIVFCSYNR